MYLDSLSQARLLFHTIMIVLGVIINDWIPSTSINCTSNRKPLYLNVTWLSRIHYIIHVIKLTTNPISKIKSSRFEQYHVFHHVIAERSIFLSTCSRRTKEHSEELNLKIEDHRMVPVYNFIAWSDSSYKRFSDLRYILVRLCVNSPPSMCIVKLYFFIFFALAFSIDLKWLA